MSVPRGLGLAFAVAVALTVVMAAPVLQAPSWRLFGSGTLGREDPNRDALIVVEQLRAGHVPSLYLQPLTDLPGRALARFVGPVAAFNLLVLSSFPLSAAAAYLLGRHVLGSHPGALVAGLAYAFLPFHVAHAGGHLHVAQTQWLPLYLLALWRCLDEPRPARALTLAAAAAAVSLSSFYGGFVAAVLSPVALVAYGVVSPRRPAQGRWRRLALTGLVLGATAAAGLVLIGRVAPMALQLPGALAFPRSDLSLYAARWWSYLVPAAEQPLLGPAVRAFWAGRGLGAALVEQQVGLGWSLLALAVVAPWRWLRGDRGSTGVRCAPVLAALLCAALVCSLSPERRIGPFTFVRPSAWLYALAPMFRAYARFGVVVGLMTALLAGAGTALLWRRPGARGRLAAVLLLGLVAFELAPLPPWPWRDVLPTRAHRWLASLPGSPRVLDCAPASRLSDALAARLLGHELSLLGPGSFDDCGEPGLGERLSSGGFSHLVLRRDSAISRWLAGRPAPAGLVRGPVFADASVLLVKAAPPDVHVDALVDFQPREYRPAGSWRWMGRAGSLRLVATRPAAGRTLELELRAFPGQRRVLWLLNGRRQGELEVATGWGRYTLVLPPLAAGESTLSLVCRAPAVRADDVIHNGDRRALGLALGDWTIGSPRR